MAGIDSFCLGVTFQRQLTVVVSDTDSWLSDKLWVLVKWAGNREVMGIDCVWHRVIARNVLVSAQVHAE